MAASHRRTPNLSIAQLDGTWNSTYDAKKEYGRIFGQGLGRKWRLYDNGAACEARDAGKPGGEAKVTALDGLLAVAVG